MTMQKTTVFSLFAVLCLSGRAATSPRATGSPPPFECTSIHPEVCDLEEQFHLLRFEQAAQNAAIDEAERRRKAALGPAPLDRG
jgi:hypothetical protein